MRHQVEKGTFSYENKERTKREKLVRTKWAFHRFGALTVYYRNLEYENGWGMELGKKYRSVLWESIKESV